MLIAFPLTAAKIVGTDIFHAAVLLAVAGAGQLVAGHVDLGATGWLLIGSVPGVLIGGRFTVRLPDRALRIALAATLTLAGIKLVDPPGSDGIADRRGGDRAGSLRSRRDGAGRTLAGREPVVVAEPDSELRRQRARHERLAGQPVADLVRRAPGAEARRGGEQREARDEQPEPRAERLEPGRVGERRGREDDEADHVREAGRARVLEAPLAEPRLDQLEVRDAGEAPAAAERQPERELQREQREQPPPARRDGEERDEADDRPG